MNLEIYKNIYFVGIGGIGMSSLARYFNNRDINVSGYDKFESDLCKDLEREGIDIHYFDEVQNISNIVVQNKHESLIVYTPAISSDNKEISFFRSNNFTMLKRSELLSLITEKNFTIAVAGTHGKTTTSTMISHILSNSDMNCTSFLGGISVNYNSNFISSTSNSEEKIFVVEADEFDRSFLNLQPNIAIITSIDMDHTDIYKDQNSLFEAFCNFSNKIKPGGTLFLEENVDTSIFTRDDISIIKYSTELPTHCYAKDISFNFGEMCFDVVYKDIEIKNFRLKMGGNYNVNNAVAAISISKYLGLENHDIVTGMNTFLGIKRRFNIHINNRDIVFIDDYAHHPSEIEQVILSVREMFPNREITVVFQPHLYTRTRDFADDFARTLSLSDNLILLDIFEARELPITGVDANLILDKCELEDKELTKMIDAVELISNKKIDVLLTLGAGNIGDLVKPIKDLLL